MQNSMFADLKNVPLFQAVADDDLRALADRAKLRSFPKDRIVFKEGAAADSLYIIVAGGVKIYLPDETGNEVVLDRKGVGQYFGEMMLDHRPRSASVITLEPSQFAVISRADFQSFIRKHPEAAEKVILNLIRIARGMNERTREGVSLRERLRRYIERLQTIKAADLPRVKRGLVAKRWLLAALLVFAVAQFYFLDVIRQIMSLKGMTVFTGQ